MTSRPTPRPRRTRPLLTLTLILLTALSTGCGTHPHHPIAASTSPPPPTSPATPSGNTPSPNTTTPTPAAGSSHSSTAALTPPTPRASTPTPAPEPTCRTGQLHLAVQRGASASQQTFATLILHNVGPVCATAGFPGVSLLRAGTEIGPPATRIDMTYTILTLAPNGSAHALLTISTACNAARSDQVRVYPPDQTTALTAPLSAFACTSHITPLHAGAS